MSAVRTSPRGKKPLVMRDVLTAMIKAHEIQGCLALENSFNRVGLDHVLLVRVASTAVVTQLLGGTRDQIVDALSHAWIDGSSLRTYRHAPERRSAQVLGSRRCDESSGSPRDAGAQGRDRLPQRADGAEVGLLRRLVQGAAVQVPARATVRT